jgi:hypothetical protein
MIKLLNQEAIDAILQESIFEAYAEEAIAEAKEYDKPHGKKLSHKILDDFFQNKAPKFNSLAAVESALKALYKENGVAFEANGIKQVISAYKKRLQEGTLSEVALSSDEKKAKDKLVIALKKSSKEYRMRFKDPEVADIHNLATAIVKTK